MMPTSEVSPRLGTTANRARCARLDAAGGKVPVNRAHRGSLRNASRRWEQVRIEKPCPSCAANSSSGSALGRSAQSSQSRAGRPEDGGGGDPRRKGPNPLNESEVKALVYAVPDRHRAEFGPWPSQAFALAKPGPFARANLDLKARAIRLQRNARMPATTS
jgi:hypothetical protein